MADADTTEAVMQVAAWHDRQADAVPPRRERHRMHLRTAEVLRALLAERDAALRNMSTREAASWAAGRVVGER